MHLSSIKAFLQISLFYLCCGCCLHRNMYFPTDELERNLEAKTKVASESNPRPQAKDNQIQNSVSWLSWNSNGTMSIPFLAITTWSGIFKLCRLTVENNFNLLVEAKVHQKYDQSSLLSCCWSTRNNLLCYYGDSEGVIRSYQLAKQQVNQESSHQSGISSLQYLQHMDLLVSTGYDRKVKFWDSRSRKEAFAQELPAKVFCGCHNPNILAFGMSNYQIVLMDMRKSDRFINCKSPLGEFVQIQSIAIHPTRNLLLTGSFDGRIAVSPIGQTANNDELDVDEEKTQFFKTHFQDTTGSDNRPVRIHYPVNMVGFSPSNPDWIFAAGSNKTLVFLDYIKRKKIKSETRGGPITAVALTADGGCLAYATGNDWHTGKNEAWPTSTEIRLMTDLDYFAE